MRDDWVFLFIIVFGSVLHLIELEHNAPLRACDRGPTLHLLLWVHHLISAFIFFGWMLQSSSALRFYILFLFAILAHWAVNGNACALTQIVKKECADDSIKFHSLSYYIVPSNMPKLGFAAGLWPLMFVAIALFSLQTANRKERQVDQRARNAQNTGKLKIRL